MPGTYPPARSAAGSGSFFPGYILQGYNGAPGGGSVVGVGSTAYFAPYKACVLVMMEFAVYATNSVAATISFQPYGAPSAGNGQLLGSALSVSVPATGGAVFYQQAQNLSVTATGYIGLGVTPTSGTSVNIALDCTLWFTQAAQ